MFKPGPSEREKLSIPADRHIVLMVSALIPSKRVEVGIEAVSRVPNSHLVVAGDGPMREHITALAARLLPDRFTRLTVSPEQMPALYRSANVFMHLSQDESFGNVFIEALACGLPVVAEDSARTRWIVGEQEFLADTTDPNGIARRLNQALDASVDLRELRVERASAFSWPKVGEMYNRFLTEIVG